MDLNIKTIKLSSKASNCYLIKTKVGFILIVTGRILKTAQIVKELAFYSCKKDNLNLIIFMHSNPCKKKDLEFLKNKYDTRIAMHVLDHEFLMETKSRNILEYTANTHSINKSGFKPDLIIDENFNLSFFGLNARVLYLPGYSKALGILTENGELFYDDVVLNKESQQNKSLLTKLKSLLIDCIYPSFGEPIPVNKINY